jgi:hypothetical protein
MLADERIDPKEGFVPLKNWWSIVWRMGAPHSGVHTHRDFLTHLQQSGMEGSAWKDDPINYDVELFSFRMTGQWQSNSLTLT